MLKINVITLTPQVFQNHFETLPFNRALLQKAVEINIINLRDFAIDNRGTVDDKPYGGGTGMILRIEPIVAALDSVRSKYNILTSPRGTTFNQEKAKQLAAMDEFTIICGRFEGVDARVEEHYAHESISIGNYVLSGGETPALVIMEATIRLLDGIFSKEGVTEKESFSNYHLEHPQYTRPEVFNNLKVPEVLISGDHSKIDQWKLENSK